MNRACAWLVLLASLGVGCGGGGSEPTPSKPANLVTPTPGTPPTAGTPPTHGTQPTATRPAVVLMPGKDVLSPAEADHGVALHAIDGSVHVRKAGGHPYLSLDRARLRIIRMYQTEKKEMLRGFSATPGDWPWAVAFLDVWKPPSLLCGGALIADDWVLTAAHCDIDVQDDAIVGANDLSKNEGTNVDIASVCVHPSFDWGTLDWDVALVKITPPLSAQQKMRRAMVDPYPLTQAMAIGWGWIDDQGNYSSVLQQVAIRVATDPACTAAYPGVITPRMLCAGENDKGGCDGDSGGPLMVQDGTSMEWSEVGIVSWGSACTTPDLYGVYSRVSQLNQWIDDTMTSSQPQCKEMY